MDETTLREMVRQVVERTLAETAVAPAAGFSGGVPTTARAAVLTARQKLEIKTFPLRPIGDDEILVRVEACGVCGTDIHCYKNDPFKLIPVVLGHEGTGEVVQVGRAVAMDSVGKPVRVGDKIVTSLMETSDACMVAKYNPTKANLCDDLRIYGLLPDEPENHFNGYFGQYLIIRPGSSFFVVNDMSLELRVLIEPAAVCVHALERAKRATNLINFRSRIIVQGCGPIGLMMIAVIKAAGVNTIIALDGDKRRLEKAKQMGADHIVNYKDYLGIEELTGAIKNLTMGVGAHFGFQVTGVPQAASNLFKLIRRGGGICEVGFFVDNGNCSINPHHDLCKKEITLVGTWAYNSYEYPNAYHFLQRAQRMGLPMESLVTHRFPLERIDDAFQAAIAQEGVKIVVENR
jgi:L-iditol 2-dehydrogenase